MTLAEKIAQRMILDGHCHPASTEALVKSIAKELTPVVTCKHGVSENVHCSLCEAEAEG